MLPDHADDKLPPRPTRPRPAIHNTRATQPIRQRIGRAPGDFGSAEAYAARGQRGTRRPLWGREERGASAVEFALVMLPVLYLVFGVIQYGMYFYATQSGTAAVGEAVRRLTVGNCQDPAQLKQFLATRLGAASTDSAATLATTVTYMDASSPPAPVPTPGVVGGSVTLQLTFHAVNMNFPFVPLPNGGTVTRSEFARVEDTTSLTNGCV